MSIWIEIHCDERIEEANKFGKPSCWTTSGRITGRLSDNRLETVNYVVKLLKKEFLEIGWTKTAKGFACPFCSSKLYKHKK